MKASLIVDKTPHTLINDEIDLVCGVFFWA